jgi:hypothetical protein
MKNDGANYAYDSSSAATAILLRSEAQLQGLNDVTWVCTIACYDRSLKAQASVMESQYVTMTFVPFEEASTNATLANFLKYVGPSNAHGFAVYGWTATLAFKQAVEAIVKKDGVNGLTRANLLSTGIDALTSFNAGGMIGNVDIKKQGADAVCGAGAAEGRQVRARRAREEGHLRLQQVECGAGQGEPDRPVRHTAADDARRGRQPMAVMPPSTGITAPFTYDASTAVSATMTWATSSGAP